MTASRGLIFATIGLALDGRSIASGLATRGSDGRAATVASSTSPMLPWPVIRYSTLHASWGFEAVDPCLYVRSVQERIKVRSPKSPLRIIDGSF